jgi:hypothetical protein
MLMLLYNRKGIIKALLIAIILQLLLLVLGGKVWIVVDGVG